MLANGDCLIGESRPAYDQTITCCFIIARLLHCLQSFYGKYELSEVGDHRLNSKKPLRG